MTNALIQHTALAAMGYLLGSIAFGLVLTRLAGLGDIRLVGSKNIGATNVLRAGGRILAVATLLLDGGKAALAYGIGYALLGESGGLAAGAAALIGHCFPLWLRLRGGKGLASFYGLLLLAAWPVGVAGIFIWLVVFLAFSYSSLSAILSLALLPFIAWLSGQSIALVATTAMLSALTLIRHIPNIKRLIVGAEPKISLRKGIAPSLSGKGRSSDRPRPPDSEAAGTKRKGPELCEQQGETEADDTSRPVTGRPS